MVTLRNMLVVVLFVVFLGCDPPKPSNNNDSNSGAEINDQDESRSNGNGIINAEDAKDTWNADQIRQVVMENESLKSLTLTSEGKNKYKGIGQNPAGVEYELDIEVKPGGIRYNWKTNEGGEGSYAFGTFSDMP